MSILKRKGGDDRRQGGRIEGGRRAGESGNPYLSARRTWNDHVGAVVAQRQTWQVVGIMALLITLAAIGGIIHIGSQSKFIPYIVEVDKLGQAVAAGPVNSTSKTDPRILYSSVADFITYSRTVTPDVALQRRAIFRVYSMLAQNDPATHKMNEWMNGTEQSSPFKRAETEMVDIEIETVLQQTADTWQVDWAETTRDRSGVPKGPPVMMRALVTVYTAAPNAQRTEEEIRSNPLGIHIRNFSWSRLR